MVTDKYIIPISECYESYILTKNSLLYFKNQATDQKDSSIDSFSLKFIGMHYNQITDFFNKEISEHELMHSFKIIATTEAILRNDYSKRVKNKFRDPLSRAFRNLHKSNPRGISLDDTLIDLWIEHFPGSKKYFSEFRRILKERHWIAHGRSWIFKSGKFHDIFAVLVTCQTIEQIINATALNKS